MTGGQPGITPTLANGPSHCPTRSDTDTTTTGSALWPTGFSFRSLFRFFALSWVTYSVLPLTCHRHIWPSGSHLSATTWLGPPSGVLAVAMSHVLDVDVLLITYI